eukprot:gb/GFBE01051892.1/.p1 GENE.gb/GFBE01051892.1/~~gb/GFBE01051892.1/.p1  ORF type:complete len:644 (+),score=88.25 gb/GFBE01051892.1/:1-1932(+)
MKSDYWLGFVDTLEIPRSLRIKNLRLGILYTLLTIGAVIWSSVSILIFRSYESFAVPSGNMFELWPRPGDRDRVANRDVPFCTDTASYNYNYSDLYTYEMSGCELLPYGETYSRTSTGLFFPTSIDDTYVWTFGAAECGPGREAESLCKEKHGELLVDFTSGAGVACQCLRHHSFFPLNPEEHFIYFTHGYEAGNMGVLGNQRMRGMSRASSNQFAQSGQAWQDMDDDGMLTIFQDDAGVECKLGTSSRYSPAEALNGIGAPIRDWLACAGATLEMQDKQVKSGHELENIIPHARVTGLELKIALEYKNTHPEKHRGVVCYVKISAQQKWNAEHHLQYETIPEADKYESHYRARVSRGISIRLVAQGRLDFFDFNQLTTAVVNAFVIISMPATIVAFIALSCLGTHSRIYSAAQSSKMSIAGECRAAVARLMSAYASYKTIPSAADGVLSQKDVDDLMQKILGPLITDGTLNSMEIAHLAAFTTAAHSKTETSGQLDLESYLRLQAYDESVQLKDLAALFDHDRKLGYLENFFQDSDFSQKRRGQVVTSARNSAFQNLRPVMALSHGQNAHVPESSDKEFNLEGVTIGKLLDERQARCSVKEPVSLVPDGESCGSPAPRQPARKQNWSPGDCSRLLAPAKESE